MSTTIDQRVVEMRFDNRHFEKNTKTTMSTLDKLRAKLNLSGAAKGLDEINKSANNVNMKGLSGALDSVSSRFTALEVMGVTALANITNSAVNAGIRIAKALTIDPVTTGFNEYELKMDSVKTIMASTGESIDTVNKYLEELNNYSDQTIYSFSDMTQNIGKFTNAGVKLEDAVMAIQGISNEAAVSGANANEAARAMYNFAQALSAGYVKLIDWKSIENANMATVEFKQQLLDTAVELGTVTKSGEDMYATLEGNVFNATKNFNEVLQDQWMTSEVLIETLKDYADATTDIGKKAFAAAQDVTKLTQVYDIAKEVAQSGWARTWEIIFGDLEEAKALFTRLSNFITGIQTRFITFRNKLLEGALSFNPFSSLLEKLDAAGITSAMNKISGLSTSLEEYQRMVTKIWRGDYNNRGDNPDRFDLLRSEGWNPSVLQVLVNKGYQYQITMEDVARAHEICNVAMEDMTKTLDELTDAQLLEMGLTKEEIELYRELEKQSKETGKSIGELISEMELMDGRDMLIEGFANLGNSLVAIFKSIGDAWVNAFPPMTSMQLYKLIDGFYNFSNVIRNYVERNVDELTRTFKGLFAVLDIITNFIGGGFKIAFTIIKGVLGAFGIAVENVLDFTALLGDGLVIIRDAIEEYLWLFDVFGVAANFITKALKAFKDWILSNKLVADSLAVLKKYISEFREDLEKLKENPELVSKIFEKLANSMVKLGKSIGTIFKNLIGSDVAQNIFDGLINGLKTGGSTIYNFLIEIGTKMLEAIKNVLGIQSPSTEFYEIGKNSMEGLYNGVSDFVKMVYNLVMSIGGKLIDIVKDLDLGSIFTIAIGGGAIYSFVSIAKAIANLTSPLEEVGDFIKQFRKTVKSLGKALEFRLFAESMKAMATAIAILAGSVIALTLVDPVKMWDAVKAIGVLMGALAVLTFVVGKFGGSNKLEFGKIALTVIGLGLAMSIMAKALKTVGNLNPEQYSQAIEALGGMMIGLILLMAVISKKGTGLVKAGSAFAGIAVAILLMGKVVKTLGKMDRAELEQGLSALFVLELFIAGLMAATKLLSGSKNIGNIGGAILGIGAALVLMMWVVKTAGKMDPDSLEQGIEAMGKFGLMIVGLMAATRLISGSKNVGKIGGAIFGVAGALLMMAFVAKIAGTMSVEDMIKGGAAVLAFSAMIVGLMWATSLIGDSENVKKIGRTMLMISVAIGIMGVTAALLSMIDIDGLKKGVGAVTILTALVGILIGMTHFAKNITGTMIAITTAIGILALSLGVLSMIDPAKLMSAATAIGIVLGMFALIVAATGISKTATVTILLIAGVVALLGYILYSLAQLPIEQTMGSAIALSALLLAMSASLVILSGVGATGPAAFIGIGALLTLIAGIGALVVGIGALMDKFPKLEEFLNKGIPVIEKIGYAIGSFFGNIIGGFTDGATSGLPAVGQHLSDFMNNANDFIVGAKSVDSSVTDGIKNLAETLLIITGTNLLETITSWLTGGKSVDKFGDSLVSLAECINGFASNLDNFDDSKLAAVTCAADAIKALAEAASSLPNEGGLWAKIAGENSLAAFGDMLPELATNLNGFVSNLGTFDPSKVETIKYAGESIKALAEAAKTIPNEGGLWGALCGENSLASFADQLPALGTNLGKFISNLGTFDNSNVDTVRLAGEAITTLSNAAQEIPNEGGFWGALCGDNSLSTFAGYLPDLGSNLATFVKKLGAFSEDSIDTVNAACRVIILITELGKTDVKATGKGLDTLGKNMGKFAEDISDFTKEFGKVNSNSIDGAISKVNSLIDMAKTLTSSNIKSLSSFGDSLKSLGKEGVKGFIEAFAGSTPKKDVTNAVTALLNVVIKGAESMKADIKKAFEKVSKAGVGSMVNDTVKGDAKQAGKDLVLGFVAGINNNKYLATNAGSSLGKAALNAAKKALDEHSPSKEAYKVGAFFGEGLVNGISEYSSKVYNTSYDVAEYAKTGLSKAISAISNLITDDMGSQPTITPVLDLSDIESGIGYMDSMFANGPTIGVMANLNAIGSGMRAKLQNGPNNDVVTAIDRLHKDIGNIGPTNNYNVNGVTYGDGDAAVTQAIETLVRAALMERRV